MKKSREKIELSNRQATVITLIFGAVMLISNVACLYLGYSIK
ncbi:MAG: hypothetical protein ACI4S2_12490 [Lachnospiraceae bacterium]